MECVFVRVLHQNSKSKKIIYTFIKASVSHSFCKTVLHQSSESPKPYTANFQEGNMRSWGVTAVCAVVVVVAGCVQAHTHHLHNTHKEREADGSRSPRDHQHYEGGEHHVEFDHEAILGELGGGTCSG